MSVAAALAAAGDGARAAAMAFPVKDQPPMEHFEYINYFDISAAIAELDAQPELWNTRTERTSNPVFHGTSDIWVRYRAPEQLVSPDDFAKPHFPVFWPVWDRLPALHSIVRDLLADVGATALGGILITKIPPLGEIKPHSDAGGWHAEFYQTKVYVPLRTNPFVINTVEDEHVVMKEGEAWYFNNLVEHSVANHGETDRITLIVCMRTEGL